MEIFSQESFTIAVDFDGTIVEHRYPKIGVERKGAIEVLRKLIADGHRLILWTVREGALLDEAIDWCRERGVTFYAVNRNYPEEVFSDGKTARKLRDIDLFIDDRALGGIPEWDTIYKMIASGNPLAPLYTLNTAIDREQEEMMSRYQKKSKKFRFF